MVSKVVKKGFFVDLVAVSYLSLIFYIAQYVIIHAAARITVYTPQDLQNLLIKDPAQALAATEQLKVFLAIVITVIIVLFIKTIIIFAVSRSYLWFSIANKKFIKSKHWWDRVIFTYTHFMQHKRWYILPFFFTLLLIPYLILALIIRFIITNIFSFNNYTLIAAGHLTTLFFSLLAIFFLFHYFNAFVRKERVWETVSIAIEKLKDSFDKFGRIYVIGTIVNTALFIPAFYITSQFYLIVLNTIVILGFIAWMRDYITT